jgi:sugar/nucleoside kinase (ribokinase family)
MPQAKFGVVAIGNALVDILGHVSENFVQTHSAAHGVPKGTMGLIEESRAVEIYSALDTKTEASGGSAANTMAGFASFGGNGAFIGKVADDILGKSFAADLQNIGITYTTPPLGDGAETGRCMETGRCIVLITPDADRTMNTFLGASIEIQETDVDKSLIENAQITYLEGYLFDRERAKAAFVKAAEIAKAAGRKIALSLSDPFCVDRHRASFLHLIENHIDILFANEDEIKSLYQVETFEEAAKAVSRHVEIAALTRGEKGAVIKTPTETITVSALSVAEVIDTTGAGDQFAAGFLYGLTEGMPLKICAELGVIAAAEVISHTGPRPALPLKSLLPKAA